MRFSQPKLSRHKSPESIWKRHLKPMMADVGCTNPREFEYGEMDYDAVIAGMNKTGLWGFYDTSKETIHYWHDGNRSIVEMIGFFAHELQHHAEHCWKFDRRNNIEAEELRADVVCKVARLAYALAYECCHVRELIERTKGEK